MDDINELVEKIEIKPYTPTLGGVIKGIDLSKKLNDKILRKISNI